LNPLEQQFQTVTEKLQQLLRQQARLKKENERLQQELAECRQAENSHLQVVEQLEQRITILKFAAGDLPEAEKKEFEKIINSYIQEVDKLIAFLGQ
jgi:cell division septum initiation protein DivIVA